MLIFELLIYEVSLIDEVVLCRWSLRFIFDNRVGKMICLEVWWDIVCVDGSREEKVGWNWDRGWGF